MEHMDMIDKLREKAGITREEAADALTRANWDMLEALVILEREGRIAPLTSSVVTSDGNGSGTGAGRGNGFAGGYNGYGYAGAQSGSYAGGSRSGGVSFSDRIRTLAKNSVAYSFMVRREDKVVISLPVIVFLIILLAAFRITAAALLIGLFCGCRYALEKRDADDGDNQGN